MDKKLSYFFKILIGQKKVSRKNKNLIHEWNDQKSITPKLLSVALGSVSRGITLWINACFPSVWHSILQKHKSYK